MELADCDRKKNLYSKAANHYREAIQLLESKSEHMMYTRDEYLIACFVLMQLEYRRRNYSTAIDYCNNFMTNSKHISSNVRSIISLYYQLIMLRLNGQECQLSDFLSIAGQGTKIERVFFENAVLAFRAHEQFDSAIRLEMTFGSLLRKSELKSKLSLALTYLEQYRLEFYQRLVMRKEDSQRIIGLIQSLLTEYPPFEGDHASLEYFLVLAQWYYLSQIIVQEEQTIVMASRMIKYFLFVGLMRDKGGRKIVRDNCYTCGQAVGLLL